MHEKKTNRSICMYIQLTYVTRGQYPSPPWIEGDSYERVQYNKKTAIKLVVFFFI